MRGKKASTILFLTVMGFSYFERMIKKSNNQKPALIISTLSAFLTPFMVSAINVALPSLGKEFGLDAISLSWVATSYILAAAIFLIPFGRLADIQGRKKIFIYGVSLFTIFSFLIVTSNSGTMLIALRALQGMSSAMIFGTSMAILISVTPPTKHGRVLGINVAAVYLGLSVGPFLSGLLTQYFGWRSIFYVNVILGIVIIVLTIWKLKGEWAEAKVDKFDFAGSIFFSLTLLLLMYGSSKPPHAAGIYTVIGSAIFLIVFILWENRIQNPVLNIKLFSENTVFAFSNLAALINYSATSAVTFLLSFYLQYVKGLSPQAAGIVLVSQPIFMTIVSPIAGRLSDKIEPRILASIGMTLSVIGLGLFVTIGSESSLTFVIMNLVILGIGFGLFSSPNTNAVMSSVRKEVYGIATATLGTMRLTGQMLSMGIVMLIFSLNVGRIQITPEYYPQFLASMRMAFIVFASLARGKVR
jgi:EmrB/QacA subfamily drug resistance transporter